MFASWLEDAEKRARELGEWRYTEEKIGVVLFHSQHDDGDFFLGEEVARFYESCAAARIGFSNEAVNSNRDCWNYPGGKEVISLARSCETKALARRRTHVPQHPSNSIAWSSRSS